MMNLHIQYKILKISSSVVVDLGDYDNDLTTSTASKRTITVSSLVVQGGIENCVVEVTFVGQIVQLKSSSDGDGYRNEARYTWTTTTY